MVSARRIGTLACCIGGIYGSYLTQVLFLSFRFSYASHEEYCSLYLVLLSSTVPIACCRGSFKRFLQRKAMGRNKYVSQS